MDRHIGKIALLVHDYDEAIQWYREKLGFCLIEDTPLKERKRKRWVTMAPSSNASFQLLLAKASTEQQRLFVGNQSGGRVFLFLYTDDLTRDYQRFLSKGVSFVRKPKKQAYGTVAVFKDVYGNLWDLIQPP